MSTSTPWRPEAKEQEVLRTPKEVLDKPPRRWPVPLMVLLAVLLGMGTGAWIAGNNERALDTTAERLVEVSERLEAARDDLATARDDLATAEADLLRLQGVEGRALAARRDHAAALEDQEQVVFAAAELFDALPAGATSGLTASPRDQSVLERAFVAANAGDEAGFRGTFTRDGRMTFVAAGLREELRGDEIGQAASPRLHLRLVGEPTQTGEFLWSRYDETGSSGVVVTELQGGRILHQWLVALDW